MKKNAALKQSPPRGFFVTSLTSKALLPPISNKASHNKQLPRSASCARLSPLLSSPEHIVRASSDQPTAAALSQRGNAAQDGTDKAGWRALFDELDPGASGYVDVHAFQKLLQAHASALSLAESKTYQKKRDEGSVLNPEDFKAVIDELGRAALVRFFGSLDIPQLLAGSVQKKAPASSLNNLLDPLQHIASEPESERLEFARLVVQDVAAMLETRIADRLVSDKVHTGEPAQADEKFKTMQLGPLAIYGKGLEPILGPPDMDVLEAMRREHTEDKITSDERFQAYNSGKLRTVTPRQEWRKVLPESTSGPINNCTYDGIEMCSDMMLLTLVLEAKLTKYEVVAIRLWSGPMYKVYNELLRFATTSLEEKMEIARQAKRRELTPEEEEEVMDAAMAAVCKEVGGRFANTIHAINSGLIKLARINPLPASRCGFRGVSGLDVPPSFLKADRFGCRGGLEGGFLSMSASQEEAVGDIEDAKGMPQLLVLTLGRINRGADISSLSYFPNEKEILMPPLSSLEVVGPSSYQRIADRGLVRVTPIGVNSNMTMRTIEELQAIRKTLHSQITNNGLWEVTALVAQEGSLKGSAGSPQHKLGQAIIKQCAFVVEKYRRHHKQDFQDHNFYSSAIQDAAMMLSWAMSLMDLHSNFGIPALELSSLSIQDHLPSSDRLSPGSTAAAMRAATLAICKQRGLFHGDLEVQDYKGRTALARCAMEGQTERAALLLMGGARIETKDHEGMTPLIWACDNGHTATAAMLIDKGADINAENKYAGMSSLIVALEKGHEATAAMLIDKGADVHATNDDGMTPLIWACEKGLEATAAMLIDNGADVHAKDNAGMTPLIWAFKNGLEATVTKLMDKGADVNAPDQQGKTPLILECEKGHDAPAAKLIENGADCNFRDHQGKTALILACERGLDVTAAMLIDKGADVEFMGKTPLFWALEKGFEATAAMLIDKGADVNIEGKDAKTPLIVACEKGLEAAVTKLVDNGANVNCKDKDGKTPLIVACETGLEAVATKLVNKGADVNARDSDGKTPLICACEKGLVATAALLIDKDANVNAENKYAGNTPLMWACRMGLEATAAILIDKGANVNFKDFRGTPPLVWAFKKGLEATVTKLIDNGADVNVQDIDETMPLFWALEEGLEAMAAKLIDNGADVNRKDFRGKTPLIVACEKGLEAVATKLVDKGADVNARDSDRKTPLIALTAACKIGHGIEADFKVATAAKHIASMLVDKGADVHAQDIDGFTALLHATKKDLIGVEALLHSNGAV